MTRKRGGGGENDKVKTSAEVDNSVLVNEIKGAPGSNYITFFLKANQKILSSPGSMIFLQGNIEKGEIKTGGIMKAFARAFGGEDFFITSYKGLEGGGKIAFSTDIPGDIVKIDIKKGEEYTISRSSFLCGTENIEISSKIVLRGLLVDEGFIMPTIKAPNGDASFWLSNYGTFEKIDLKENETILIDNGIFLAAPSQLKYTLVKLGKSFISSILGGEGLGMKFTGPGHIYIQSKNLNDLFDLISKYVRVTIKSSNKRRDLGENVLDVFQGEGGGKKNMKKRGKSEKNLQKKVQNKVSKKLSV